ncbi:YHS domain-containing protein [Geothrix sp.]|uniref:YHS domain-containing protein n=1 Tax=Geothrix sp. TaxID=1962974 RepID=UPI0025BBB718|nr:YHS domain-containing protein [Geothrix sp.]WIL19834.1 MAG: YHS domain-containing protein [Geothrix sp.]
MSESKTFTKDPTCGMNVEVATALHAVRDGRTYSFCSDQCRARFQAVSAGEAVTCGS